MGNGAGTPRKQQNLWVQQGICAQDTGINGIHKETTFPQDSEWGNQVFHLEFKEVTENADDWGLVQEMSLQDNSAA